MKKEDTVQKFYDELDRLFATIEKLLGNYGKSQVLQEYLLDAFRSLAYGNLILNFFKNLNQENIREYNLPKGKIRIIKTKYKDIIRDAKLGTSLYPRHKRIDDKYYNMFKSRLQKDFPEFMTMLNEIEKIIDIERLRNYLYEKERQIKKLGKNHDDFNNVIMTTILEIYVKKEKQLPIGQNLGKLIKFFATKSLPEISQFVATSLQRNARQMLDGQRLYQTGFESRLYDRWKEPIDLLETLIRISLEAAESRKDKLTSMTDKTDIYKRSALMKIHARALHIANEILTLLKAGYADGANARWRSLHELAVISFFLKANSDEVSQRYLEHDVMRIFKDAKDYKKYHKKLGYPPLSRKEFNAIKKQHDKLLQKYGSEFEYKNGFEWIPRTILRSPNFRALEEYVKLPQYHPFYNLSSATVHGGSRGFYRLGLMKSWQNKLLLVGPTNYGLADPLQNTAISLLHVTACLLTLRTDFEGLMILHAMDNFVKEIGKTAVKTQEQIEGEEKSKQK